MNLITFLLQIYFSSLKRKKNSACLDFLILQVLPLIKKLNSSLVKRWEAETNDYHVQSNKLEKNIYPEAEEVLNVIETRLIEKNIINDDLKVKIKSIRAVLNFETETIFPDCEFKKYERNKKLKVKMVKLSEKECNLKQVESIGYGFSQSDELLDRLKELFHCIVSLGELGVVDGYVVLRKITEYEETNEVISYACDECRKIMTPDSIGSGTDRCPMCNSPLEISKVTNEVTRDIIDNFDVKQFIPSLFQMHSIRENYEESLASTWEILMFIKDCYNPESRWFFKNKLRYTDKSEYERSMKLLTINSLLVDVNNIKRNNKSTKNLLFTREYIELLITKIIEYTLEKTDDDTKQPIVLRLEIDDNNCLNLNMLDFNLVFKMHQFENDEKLKFFKNLIEDPGEFIDFKKYKTPISKCLRQVGFSKLLCKLFGVEADKSGAKFQLNTIDCTSILKGDLKEMSKEISNFPLHKDYV